MRARQIAASSLIVIVALVSMDAFAQPREPLDAKGIWLLGLGGQADEHSNDSYLATFDVGVGRNTWLSFAAGHSSSPPDFADVEADTVMIGLDHRFEHVGFRLSYEEWGDAGVLETQDWGGVVYFDRERWRIGFGYETRDIAIPFTFTGPLGRVFESEVDVDSERYGLDARVALAELWTLYLGMAEYDYSRNLHAIPRIESLNLLSSSTLTLANSFVDQDRSLGLERRFGRVSLTVRYATDVSAIDDSEFETYDAAVLFPIGRRADLEVSLGHGRSEFFETGLYGGLFFLIYSR
jgi:hypothetical protein